MSSLIAVTTYLAIYLAFLVFCGVLGAAAWVSLASGPDRRSAEMPDLATALFVLVGTGMGISITGLFLLAVFRALDPYSLTLAALLALLVASVILGRLAPDVRSLLGLSGPSSPGAVWTVPIVIYCAGLLLGALRQPFAWDELSYHLPYARDYLQAGGLTVDEHLRYPLHSHNFNLLFALALMVSDERLAHLFHGGSALLIALGLFGLARRTLGVGTAVLAVIVLFSFDGFRQIVPTAHVDLGLALFVTLAGISLVNWESTGRRSWLYVAAMATGMAMGTKYIGAVFAPLFGLWVLTRSRSLRETLLFSAIVSLFGTWWYVRSFLISGNPVHPFAGDVFGYYLWDAQDLASQHADLASHAPATGILAPVTAALRVSLGKHPELSVLALPFFAAPLVWRRLASGLRALFFVSAAYYLFWACYLGPSRYLMAVMPAIGLFSGAVIAAGAQTLAELPKLQTLSIAFRQRASLIRAVPVALVSLLAARETMGMVERLGTWPWTSEEQVAYMTEEYPGYALIRAANESPEIDGGRLYLMGFGNLTYWYRGQVLGDYFGIARYRPLYTRDAATGHAALDPEKVAELANRFDVTAVLVESAAFPNLDQARWLPRLRLLAQNELGTLWLINRH